MSILIKILIKVFIITSLFVFSLSASEQRELEVDLANILNKESKKASESAIISPKNSNKNIDELGFVLYDSVRKKIFDKVDSMIENYKQHQDHDKNLVKYISSEKAMLKRDYAAAINLYQEILITQANFSLIELKLAHAYVKDKHYEEALISYRQLQFKYNHKLPKQQQQFIAKQISNLEEYNLWQGVVRFGSSYNTNLNEAGDSNKKYCYNQHCMSSTKAIAGGKWNYSVELSKYFPLRVYHSGYFNMGISGLEPMKAVSDRKIALFFYGGYQYQRANKKIRLLPIIKTKWQANQYRNMSLGGKALTEYSLTDKMTFLADIELRNKQYQAKYAFNNGYKLNYSLTAAYIVNPRLMVFLRAHGINRGKKLASDSYQQQGVNVGLLKIVEPFELFSVVGYKHTQFNQFDGYLNVKRKDDNWHLNSQISLPSKTIFTFVPSVYVNYQVNNSTAEVIYAFKQSEVGVNFSNKF